MQWRVYIGANHDPNDDSDGIVVLAFNAHMAAERGLWCYDSDNGSGPTLDPTDVVVKRDGKVVARYSVCGKVSVTYSAKAIG